MIQVERCKFPDLGRVTNFEAATQEFPRDQEKMKKSFFSSFEDAFLAYVGTRHVGYATVTFDKLHNVTIIDAIAAHPSFRRVGVATALVSHISEVSHSDSVAKLHILVPSYLIEDKEDPWNIEHWLWRSQFKAVTSRTDACRRYGRDYDLYVFERKVL